MNTLERGFNISPESRDLISQFLRTNEQVILSNNRLINILSEQINSKSNKPVNITRKSTTVQTETEEQPAINKLSNAKTVYKVKITQTEEQPAITYKQPNQENSKVAIKTEVPATIKRENEQIDGNQTKKTCPSDDVNSHISTITPTARACSSKNPESTTSRPSRLSVSSSSSTLPNLDLDITEKSPSVKESNLREAQNQNSITDGEKDEQKTRTQNKVKKNFKFAGKMDKDYKIERELIDEGHVKIPALKNAKSILKSNSKYQSLKIMYSIIRRYRQRESCTGASAYLAFSCKIVNRPKFCAYFCCHNRIRKCPVNIIFEYTWKTQAYKLYKVGCHNHELNYKNNSRTLEQWDQCIENEEMKLI